MKIYSEKHLTLQTKVKEVASEIASFLKTGVSEKEAYRQAIQIIKNDNRIEGIWHPIVIKFNKSTLIEGVKYRPLEEVKLKDIAVIDLGLIVDGVEIDYGITVGFSEKTQRLVRSAKDILNLSISELKESHNKYSPSSFYKFICEQAKAYNVDQIAQSAGHSLGVYPTSKSKVKIHPLESALDFSAYPAWMIEIHVSDGNYGAFFEDLVYLA